MLRSFLLSALCFAACQLSPAGILTLDPSSGNITGEPGQLVGWGFTLQPNATYWTSVIDSFLINESNPGLGAYTDLIGPQGGPDNGVLPPAQQTSSWTENFNATDETGVGSYAISPSVRSGADTGDIEVQLELASADPIDCPRCIVSIETIDLPFSVIVVDAPEPATGGLTFGAVLSGIALAGFGALRRKKIAVI